MHYRSFMTFNKEKANNSEEARFYVRNFLEEEGFCSDGFFSSSIADWFVIGGRWSGKLQDIKIFDEVMKMLKKKKDEHIYTSDLDDEKTKKKIQKIWESKGGKGESSYTRNQYNTDGYEDDAMIVTKKLYDKFLKDYEGTETDGEHFWDLDYEEVSEKFIGTKYIVVCDYHN